MINADLGSGTPEQIQAIVKDFWSAQEPILTSMEPAPDPIRADVATLLALAHQGASTGDSATFTSEDLQTADRNIDQYMLRECGYGKLSITATDNAYHGIPATVGVGTLFLRLAPGRYSVSDFLAQGTTSVDTSRSGEPNYALGLHGEFTVI